MGRRAALRQAMLANGPTPGVMEITRELRAALWSRQGMALLSEGECGWMDGGCVILADALVALLAPDALRITFISDSGPEHCVCSFAGWWMDASGIGHPWHMRRNWEVGERVQLRATLPLSDAELSGLWRDPATSQRVADFLDERLSVVRFRQAFTAMTWPTRSVGERSGARVELAGLA